MKKFILSLLLSALILNFSMSFAKNEKWYEQLCKPIKGNYGINRFGFKGGRRLGPNF